MGWIKLGYKTESRKTRPRTEEERGTIPARELLAGHPGKNGSEKDCTLVKRAGKREFRERGSKHTEFLFTFFFVYE